MARTLFDAAEPELPVPTATDLAAEPTAAERATQLVDQLWLCLVPGIGPRLRTVLLERFGSPGAIRAARGSDFQQVPGIGTKLATALVRAKSELDPLEELARCKAQNVHLIPDTSDRYPRALREIHDPPGILYVQGDLRPSDALAVAVVGSRQATRYGKQQAERLAGALARAGITVVSGLARGIDAAAHRGAVNAGGRTIAVLGSGLGKIYPPEHLDLAVDVATHGAVVSELPLLAPPLAGTFPQRNRIISGISLGVLVIEAAPRSGALITARHAMEQGREVFALPGPVDSPLSQGCHKLIRDGAKLVSCVEDVLEELGPLVAPTPRPEPIAKRGGPKPVPASEPPQTVKRPAELLLNDHETRVLQAVTSAPEHADTLIVSTGLPAHRVLATLSVLELRKLVRRLEGNRWQRT